jgi:molybdenum cofactor synthesis domain-containing protein
MKAAIITVSDGCSSGTREDLAMPALRDTIQSEGWEIVRTTVVPDDIEPIQQTVLDCCRGPEATEFVVTTGGTGVTLRDVTPEAVRPLLDKEIPGLGELMRLKGMQNTDFAALSRSLAGSIGQSLVLCLPGSPKGATESLQAVIHLIPHVVDLLHGRTKHA